MIRLPKILKRRPVVNSGAAPATQDDVRMLRVVTDSLHASFIAERAHLIAKLERAKAWHEPTADLSRRLTEVNHKLVQFENKARRNG